jgi:hypothetical protein
MKRIFRVCVGGSVAMMLFAAGYFAGQQHTIPAAQAAPQSIWADFCHYRLDTRSFTGGSETVLTAWIARWDDTAGEWESVGAFAATQAVTSFDCKREY